MANTTTSKKTQNKTGVSKRNFAAESQTSEIIDTVISNVVEPKQTFTPREIDSEQYVTVVNGYQGKLVYKSARTGEKYTWSSFGDEQEMQLRELKSAKNSNKKFFINNWFMFPQGEEWVIDYLGVGKFYQYALGIDEFDDLFDMPAEEMREVINKLSDGQKKSVKYMALQKIENGEIDSRKTISMLEDALETELIEK